MVLAGWKDIATVVGAVIALFTLVMGVREYTSAGRTKAGGVLLEDVAAREGCSTSESDLRRHRR